MAKNDKDLSKAISEFSRRSPGAVQSPSVLWRGGQPSTESGVSTSLTVQEDLRSCQLKAAKLFDVAYKQQRT